MIIERDKNEIIIRIPASLGTREIQDVLDFIRYRELTSKFKSKESQVNNLSSSVNKRWWKKNAKKFTSK